MNATLGQERCEMAALVTARFTGAELVYANLDDATIERVRDAFANQVPAAANAV